jgi:hypothetical protein
MPAKAGISYLSESKCRKMPERRLRGHDEVKQGTPVAANWY